MLHGDWWKSLLHDVRKRYQLDSPLDRSKSENYSDSVLSVYGIRTKAVGSGAALELCKRVVVCNKLGWLGSGHTHQQIDTTNQNHITICVYSFKNDYNDRAIGGGNCRWRQHDAEQKTLSGKFFWVREI